MKIQLANATVFRDEDVRALLRKCLRAVGYAPVRGYSALRVEVVYCRTRNCSGEAYLGTNRKLPGRSMRLRFPPLERWNEDTWRRVVAVTVHECMHLVGSEHKDMTEAQLYCTLPLPAWAADLTPIRVVEAEPEVPLEARRAAAKADQFEHAQAMLKKAQTRAKRANTILTKWKRRVARLSK